MSKKIILRNYGVINPEDIDDYISHKGFQALQKALQSLTPEEVIREIKESGLRKREGHGAPVGEELSLSRGCLSDRKYIVCTTIEGDPTLAVNKKVLEGDPLSIIEGMIITGYAIEATVGYIYCQRKNSLTLKRIKNAIAQAKKRNYLGKNILKTAFSFDIEVKEGNGDFVCIEDTALIASLEGKKARSRTKPPLPAQSGIDAFPTFVSTVETFANIVPVIINGPEWYRGIGTEMSTGTKIFQITSGIVNGNLIEVPLGTPLKEVITMGDEPVDLHAIKAIQLGGPLGCILPREQVDIALDFEAMERLGILMNTTGLTIVEEGTDMAKAVHSFLKFTHKESCGKCVTCRIGSKRMLEILDRIIEGNEKTDDLEQLREIALVMKDSALCILGQNIPNPVLSFVNHFH
jgi:NADH:ubiquinone oxidoreductase subunit F (NADH-binding)